MACQKTRHKSNRVKHFLSLSLSLSLKFSFFLNIFFTFLFEFSYVPSNYVKKEKKSIFDKIIPRMLQNASNNNNNNNSSNNSNNSNNNNNKPVGNDQINSSNPKLNTQKSHLTSISRATVKHKYNALK